LKHTKPDITAIINFHAEGIFAESAIRSFLSMCDYAEECGLTIERLAVLDRIDTLTASIISGMASRFSKIENVDFGDLGDSRNFGISCARGRFIALLDGDDMWGKSWLTLAHQSLGRIKLPVIAHPEWMYYFNDEDFSRTALYEKPADGSKSFFMRHIASVDPLFDASAIMFNNIYSSNSFASRELLLKYPFLKVDRTRGLGVEDWYWNALTLRDAVKHLTIPHTVHLIRVKSSATSLGFRNAAGGLLPPLYNLYG
jgi:hypothetical protein